jgi:hypothetical protein
MMLMFIPGIPGLYAQQQGTSPQGSEWYCPWMNRMGGGMHHGGGWGRCCMMGQGAMAYNPQGQPVTMEQAKQMLENYVSYKKDPNLKVGEVSDKGDVFEATVVTKDGALVEKIQVNKKTGWFRNVS